MMRVIRDVLSSCVGEAVVCLNVCWNELFES